ncbi:hypothetical protein PGTUg99_030759 [Puccinia graminis f. sp. tritici]|uniref:Uncharacterized protein n=1 Tax=Puccinia graminis f. sp. tritici TaxID=56615 RepID=A0A5B0SEF4_PUCGR|nr:hypothetical protein PGTUg99_030759 [Puccinia graminis f. sp. tritici]
MAPVSYPAHLQPPTTPASFVRSTTSSYPDRPFDRRPLPLLLATLLTIATLPTSFQKVHPASSFYLQPLATLTDRLTNGPSTLTDRLTDGPCTPCLFVLSTTSSYPDRPFDRRPLYPDRPFDQQPLYPPIYLPKRPPAALLPHSKSYRRATPPSSTPTHVCLTKDLGLFT